MGKIKKAQKNKKIDGDFNDPFAPNLNSERIVVCLHCGEEYKENEIKWDKKADLWVCKNYPRCDGAGLGYDIHHKDDA